MLLDTQDRERNRGRSRCASPSRQVDCIQGEEPPFWRLLPAKLETASQETRDGSTRTADKTILVTGATGRQGSAVIRSLRWHEGWHMRALTRTAGSDAALDLARQGVEVMQGDLEDLGSLERATRGVYGIYSVQDFWAVGAEREVQQGKNLADAAKQARVEHFVYSSVGGVERNAGIGHWASKWEIEQHIRTLGLPATMIRPASFMENYYIDETEIGILQGRFVDAVRADKPYQTIAVDDIGAFVAWRLLVPRSSLARPSRLLAVS